MAKIGQLAAVFDIAFDSHAGVNEPFFKLSDLPLDYDLTGYVPDNLTGFSASGSVMADCGGVELFPLLMTTNITFITDTAVFATEDDNGVAHDWEIPLAQGIRLKIPPLQVALITNTAFYFVNLVAPDGSVIAFIKGALTNRDCTSGCC